MKQLIMKTILSCFITCLASLFQIYWCKPHSVFTNCAHLPFLFSPLIVYCLQPIDSYPNGFNGCTGNSF
jgi:hypothetical protein